MRQIIEILLLFSCLNWITLTKQSIDCEDHSFQKEPCFVKIGSISYVQSPQESVIFPCSTQNADEKQYFISWWKVGQRSPISLNRIIKNSKLKDKYKLIGETQSDWYLKIDNLTFEDEGAYACQINSYPVKEKVFHLRVKRKNVEIASPGSMLPVNEDTFPIERIDSNENSLSGKDHRITVEGSREARIGTALILNCSITFLNHTKNPKTPIWCKVKNGKTKPLYGHFFIGDYNNSKENLQRMSKHDQYDIKMRWINNTYRSVLSLRKVDRKHAGIYVCSNNCNKKWPVAKAKHSRNWINVAILPERSSHYDSKLSADDPMQDEISKTIKYTFQSYDTPYNTSSAKSFSIYPYLLFYRICALLIVYLLNNYM